jgi:hypothetical protein
MTKDELPVFYNVLLRPLDKGHFHVDYLVILLIFLNLYYRFTYWPFSWLFWKKVIIYEVVQTNVFTMVYQEQVYLTQVLLSLQLFLLLSFLLFFLLFPPKQFKIYKVMNLSFSKKNGWILTITLWLLLQKKPA